MKANKHTSTNVRYVNLHNRIWFLQFIFKNIPRNVELNT